MDKIAELSGMRFGVEIETIGISRKDAKFMFTWMLLASMGGNLEILQKKIFISKNFSFVTRSKLLNVV